MKKILFALTLATTAAHADPAMYETTDNAFICSKFGIPNLIVRADKAGISRQEVLDRMVDPNCMVIYKGAVVTVIPAGNDGAFEEGLVTFPVRGYVALSFLKKLDGI